MTELIFIGVGILVLFLFDRGVDAYILAKVEMLEREAADTASQMNAVPNEPNETGEKP